MIESLTHALVELIEAAVNEVHSLHGKGAEIPDHRVDIPEIVMPHKPMAGNMPLSKEALSITVKTIQRAAAADSLAKALEINYQGAGEISCTESAREGITAFLEKRRPEFKK